MAEGRPKISIVGHGQVPPELHVPAYDIRIFRAPDGRASTFFEDSRLSDVLEWPHDICLLWIGSNDISVNTVIDDVVNSICEIVFELEKVAEEVVVILLEPKYSHGPTHDPTQDPDFLQRYGKIQRGMNKALRKRMRNKTFVRVNTVWWANKNGTEGVHFDEQGKNVVVNKLVGVIDRQVEKLRSNGAVAAEEW